MSGGHCDQRTEAENSRGACRPGIDGATEKAERVGASDARVMKPRLQHPCTPFPQGTHVEVLCALAGLATQVKAKTFVAAQRGRFCR